MTRRKYHVSGVAQITVYAESAHAAMIQALQRAERMSKGRVVLELENICTDDHASVGFDNVAELDEEVSS